MPTTSGCGVPKSGIRRSGWLVVAALAGRVINHDDAEIRHPDGTVVPFQICPMPVTGPDGSVEYAIAALVDISDRVRAEEALRASEERFRTSVEVLPDGFAVFSAVRDSAGAVADFRYEYINEAGCRLDQRSREDTVGHTIAELFPGAVTSGMLAEYAQVTETGEPLAREDVGYEDVYGGRQVARAFDLRIMKLGDGIVANWRDVAERRQAEETMASQAAALRRSTADLEDRVQQRTNDLLRSNQELEGFSYSVAHDLRAPLRAIHGYCQILLGDHAAQLDEDGQVLLGNVARYAERMGQLIEGLLALASVGLEDPRHVPIDMTTLAGSVVADLQEGHTGSWPAIAVGQLTDATGDPGLIRQVWEHLIGNAGEVQHGPGGRRSQRGVPGHRRGSDLPRARQRRRLRHGLRREALRASSASTPPSFPARASAWPSSPASWAARAAESGPMAASATAHASRSPCLPSRLRKVSRHDRQHRHRPGGAGRILLAEDEPSDADLCMRALQRKNVANRIVWVKDGARALDFLFARGPYASRAHARRPRLLLLDIKMPKVDGFEVLRQLRADERLATMPVVIMTSSDEERDIVQGYHLGVNSYVPKSGPLHKLPAGRRGSRPVLDAPQQSPRNDARAVTTSPGGASDEGYRALFENSLDAVFFTAPDGQVFAANPAACAMFGFTEKELCALGREGIFDPADRARATAALATRASAGQIRAVLSYRRRDGTTFPGEVSSRIFTDASGEQRTCIVLRDITEREQMRERLADQLRQTWAANDELASFTNSRRP